MFTHMCLNLDETILCLYLTSTRVESMPPLHIHLGQLVKLAIGFIITPTEKAKLSLK